MIDRLNSQLVLETNQNIHDIACITIEGSEQIGIILWNGHYWTVSRLTGSPTWSIDIPRSRLSIEDEIVESIWIPRFESKISTFEVTDIQWTYKDGKSEEASND